MAECRQRAHEEMARDGPVSRAAAAVIILVWLLLVALAIALIRRALSA